MYLNKNKIESFYSKAAKKVLKFFFLVFLCAFFTATGHRAQAAADASLYFNPSFKITTNGSTFTLDVMVNPGSHQVSEVDLVISYDQTKLQLNSFSSVAPFPSANNLGSNINNTNGTANYSIYTNFGTNVTTTTTYATLSFTALGEVNGSSINITTSSGVYGDDQTGVNQLGTRTPATVTIDSTAPAGGSITYTNGYYVTPSVSLTTGDGTDSGSGLSTGTRTVQRKSATLSNGTCASFGSFATITPTGSAPNYTDSTVVSGNCYMYQYLISDNAGNQATYTSANVVKVDTAGPSGGSINFTDGYYTAASVALTTNDGTDSVSGLNTGSRIVKRKSATLSNGICNSYGSFATITPSGTAPNLTDSTVSSGNCYQYQYLISDSAGNQTTYSSSNTAKVDTSVPSGGSITYTNGYVYKNAVLTVNYGTNTISGINNAGIVVQRRSATPTGGVCGSYGSWSTISTTGTYPSLSDATIAEDTCYQYQYLVPSNSGLQTAYTTTNVVKSTFSSDLNNSGAVDGADFSLLHANFWSTTPGNVADITGDNVVNGADFSILHAEYNRTF